MKTKILTDFQICISIPLMKTVDCKKTHFQCKKRKKQKNENKKKQVFRFNFLKIINIFLNNSST